MLAGRVSKLIEKIWLVEKAVLMNVEASELWGRIYSELSSDKGGLVGAVVARGEAQVVRLALIYALLDGADAIRLPHLKAALAVWQYCEDSARYIFGKGLGDGVADTILAALRQAGAAGMSRTDFFTLFGRNLSATKISSAVLLLEKYGLAKKYELTRLIRKGGRPSERWCCT